METLLVVASIFAVGAITPGPNNLMVMAAGAKGGLAAAAPVICGVVAGGLLLLGLAWSGVAAAIAAEPRLRSVLTSGGAVYLVWLGGVTIRRARPIVARSASARGGHGWLGVAAFQLLNPKAWLLVLTASAVVSTELEGARGLALLAGVYIVRSSISLPAWALAGSVIGGLVGDGRGRLGFERTMGGLLVALGLFLAADAL